MMNNRFLLIAFFVLSSASRVFAEDGGTIAQYLWVTETSAETAFKAQLGLGLLDNGNPVTGSRGTPITNYFGADYMISDGTILSVGLPLAGTLSGGNDDYGIGNITLGIKHALPLDRFRLAFGANLALPTSQSRSVVGIATRQFVQYVQDQFAVSPYVAASYVRDRLTFTVDFGSDIQIFTEDSPLMDTLEMLIFYDAGAAFSIYENLWTTLEFGGYSSMTYDSSFTSLYAGPGIRYQDHEVSLGFHFLAPFRSPSKDIIDFMTVFDVRLLW